ncbi:hypothetical protein [Pseudoalteromonas byunsanensis]|uniref:Lipoprotein n=1 Tax=Pseudoalteromonas byunsanensis TaxID=327939 RepID=A0A1S1N5D7_9GAMM|nr:hypothetical protein [Pseudoalteromonas byunsanensis]OHU94875.1 hypothetical protein BIW53_12705 [Pseudoalteromonas byunsanensis]
MKLNQAALSLSVSCLLAACGGNETQTIDTLVNKIPARFSTNVVLTDYCKNEISTSASVVFHDVSGAPIEITEVNGFGQVNLEMPKGTKHVSVVTSVSEFNIYETHPYEYIRTYLDVEHGLMLHRTSFLDRSRDGRYSGCGCKYRANFDLSQINSSNFSAQLHNATWNTVDESIKNVCSSSKYAYMTINSDTNGTPRAAKYDLTQGDVTPKGSDFVHYGVALSDAKVINEKESLSVSAVVGNQEVFTQDSSFGNPHTLYIFPQLVKSNKITSYLTERNRGSLGSDAILYYFKSSKVDEDGYYRDLSYLPAQDVHSEFVQSFVSAVNNDSINTSFNYSSISDTVFLVSHQLVLRNGLNTNIRWHIESGAQSTIPELSFGDLLLVDMENRKMMDLSVEINAGGSVSSHSEALKYISQTTLEQRILEGNEDVSSVIVSLYLN